MFFVNCLILQGLPERAGVERSTRLNVGKCRADYRGMNPHEVQLGENWVDGPSSLLENGVGPAREKGL